MNKCIPIFIIQLILVGCQSQFEMTEEGNGCPKTGIEKSHIDATNFYQYQYYQIDENSPCQRRQCLNGEWIVDQEYMCANSCLDEEGNNPDNLPYCGECFNNDQRCDGNIIQHCNKGKWEDSLDCEKININDLEDNKTSCIEIDDIASCGTCLNGKEKFLNQNDACTHLVCNNAHWELDTTFSCPSKDAPHILASCLASALSQTPTTASEACGTCRNGDMKCTGTTNNKIEQCINGVWVERANCGITSCTLSENINVGEAGDSSSKSSNAYVCGECENGATKLWNHASGVCISSTCKNGKWVDDLNHCGGFSCIEENGKATKCGECLNASKSCNQDSLEYQICQNATFASIFKCKSCNNDICMSNLTEYSPNSCPEGTDPYIIAINEDGEVSICSSSCTNGICKDCADGDITFNQIQNICSYKECMNGSFSPSSNCKKDEHSVSCIKSNDKYTDCGECLNGSYVFTETNNICTYKKCTSGSWSDTYTCTESVSCRGTAPDYTGCGECQNGATKFTMNGSVCQHYECESGMWVPKDTCGGNVSCQGTAPDNYNDCGVCLNGEYSYSETNGTCTYKKCVSGIWDSPQNCPNNVSCQGSKDNYKCGECKNSNKDSYYMEGSTCYHKKCTSGVYSSPTKCDNGNSCKGTVGNYTDCGECINGKKYNITEASDICNYRECSAGKLGAVQFCLNAVSCNRARTDCGVCRNKKTKCEQGYLFTCTDGAWPAKGTFCPKGCNSNGEKCKS